MAYFEVLHHQHFLGGTEESHEKHRSRQSVLRPIFVPNTTQDRVYSVTGKPNSSIPHSGQLVCEPRTNPESPEYKAGVLLTGPPHSVRKTLETRHEEGGTFPYSNTSVSGPGAGQPESALELALPSVSLVFGLVGVRGPTLRKKKS